MIILPDTATGSRPVEELPASVPFCALGTNFLSSLAGSGSRSTYAQALEAALCADAVVLGGGLSNANIGPLLHLLLGRYRDRLPVLAVDALVGPVVQSEERLGRASLCSLDKEESAAATKGVSYSFSVAEETGAAFVVISLGEIQVLHPIWEKLMRRFLRGDLLLEQESAQQFMAARDALGVTYMNSCFKAIATLLKRAAQTGLTLLVRNPRHPFAMPAAPEMTAILQEFGGAPLQPMLDMPGASFCSVMQCFRMRDIVTAFANGPVCHLSDACGVVGGLIPGQGEIDLTSIVYYLKGLKHSIKPYFDPWPGLEMHEIRSACATVRTLIDQ